MSKTGGCLYILLLLKLVNMSNARPAVKSSDEIYFDMEEEMSTTNEANKKTSIKNDTYFARRSETYRNTLIQFVDPNRVIFPSEGEETAWDAPQGVFTSAVKSEQSSTCTEEDDFCEDVATYPYVHLNEILQTNKVLRDVFESKHVEEEMTSRIDEQDTFLCPSVVKTIFPKLGKNKKKKWKYIINQDEFAQSIRVEVCRNDGAPCDLIEELPNGYTTTCKQKYIYTRLLSLDTRGSPIVDVFPLPSACACAYKKDVNFLARIGARLTPKGGKRKIF